MIDLLKIRQILDSMNPSSTGPTFPGTTMAPQPMDEKIPLNADADNDDLEARLRSMFQPNEEQFNQLTALKAPNRADYNPSLMRKIAALGAGLGGNRPSGMWGGQPVGFETDPLRDITAQRAVLNEPYDKAVADYELKLKPLQETAKLEGTRNVNERMIRSQELTNERENKRIAEAERKNKEAERLKQADLERKQKRDEAYIKAKQFAMDHPKYERFIDSTGKLVFVNPEDPTAKPIETGLDSVSPLELAEFNVKGRLQAIAATGAEQRKTEGTRQEGRLAIEAERDKNRQALETLESENDKLLEQERQRGRLEVVDKRAGYGMGTGAGGAGDSTTVSTLSQNLTPAKRTSILRYRAIRALAEHPELEGYIVVDPVSTREPQLPASGVFGGVFVNQDKVKEAHRLIYGDNAPMEAAPVPEQETTTRTTTKTSTTAPPKLKDPNASAAIQPVTAMKNGKQYTKVKDKATGKVVWVTNPDLTKYELVP